MRNIMYCAAMLTLLLGMSVPVREAYAQRSPSDLEAIDVSKSAFPHTKSGCSKKAQFFMAMIENYKRAKDPAEIAPMKIMKPLVQEVYNAASTKGISQASIDNIETYRECAKTAEPERNEAKEKKQMKIFKACEGITEVAMGSLRAVKLKQSKKSALGKYESKELIVENTLLENLKDPSVYLVEQIFDKAEKQSFDVATDYAVSVTMSCLKQ